MGGFGQRITALVSARVGLAAILLSIVLLSACAGLDEEQKDTAKGAGIGVAAGAVIGGLLGGRDGAAAGAVLGGAAGAVGGNIWSKKMEEKRRTLEQSTRGTGVEVARTSDNQLKLQVPSDISFDTGSADLKPSLRTVLDEFAKGVSSDPGLSVRVVGHTDSTGSEAVNERLSLERAASVGDYLVDRGVTRSRIDASGRGARQPLADNASADGRARNRRVEIFLREAEQAS